MKKLNPSKEKRLITRLVELSGFTEEDTYLEIGTRYGDSLKCAVDGNDRMKIISIDKHQTDEAKHYFGKRATLIESKSHKACKRMIANGTKISGGFIDGNHEEHYVQQDLDDVWKLWNGKGFIAGHDFAHRRNTQVVRSCIDFFGLEPSIKINRQWRVRDGLFFVIGTIWAFILDKSLPKYQDYIDTL